MYQIKSGDQVYGPYSVGQIKSMGANGQIDPSWMVRQLPEGQWRAASSINGLLSSASETTCPFCNETIKVGSKKCKHCNEILDPVLRAAQSSSQPSITINNTNSNANSMPVFAPSRTVYVRGPTWNPLIAFLLSLIIPGVGQLYKGQPIAGCIWFFITVVGYVAFIVPGLILHVICMIDAAVSNP